MPEIARFYGIVIRMYFEVGSPHHRPHLHAYYQERRAVVGLDNLELIAGSFPRKQKRLLLAWAELHRQELNANWELLQAGMPPRTIEPLR